MFPEGVTGAPYLPTDGYRWLETIERTSGWITVTTNPLSTVLL